MTKKKRSKSKSKKMFKWRAVPLKGSFMVTSILGMLLSYYYVYPVDINFGIACILLFALMFIASLVSLSRAPIHVDGIK